PSQVRPQAHREGEDPATDGGEGEEEGGWMERPVRWRAPSWSWAAVKAPVAFLSLEEGMEAECEVVDVQTELAGPDPCGELQEDGTYLVLKGRLVPAVLALRDRKPGDQLPRPSDLIELD